MSSLNKVVWPLIAFIVSIFWTFRWPIKLDEPLTLDYIYFDHLQPDHYGVFYWLAKVITFIHLEPIITLRIINSFLLAGSIYLVSKFFQKWNSFGTQSLLIAWALSHFYLMNYVSYAFEYSLFLFLSITSLYHFLVLGQSPSSYKSRLFWINILGLSSFAFYNIFTFFQFINLFYDKKLNRKDILYFSLLLIIQYFLLFKDIIHFRLNDYLSSSSKTFYEIATELAGFDWAVWAQSGLNKSLIFLIFVISLIFVVSLLVSAIRQSKEVSLLIRIQFLVFFSVFIIVALNVLGFRESEWRYVIFIFLCIPICLSYIKQWTLPLRALLVTLIFVNLFGSIFFLKNSTYGNQDYFIQKIEKILIDNSIQVVYTNHFWNFKYLIRSQVAHSLNLKGLKLNLDFLRVSTETPPPGALFIKYSEPEPNWNDWTHENNLELVDKFQCSRCDINNAEVYWVRSK